MKHIIVKLTAKPEGKAELMDALKANKKGSEQEAGFIGMRLFEDNNNPNIIFVIDSWKDEEALESHKQTPHVQNMLKVAQTTLACPPQIFDMGETYPLPVEAKEPNPEDKLFIIFFIFKIKEEYREQLLKQFETHVENTRKEEGCLLFDFYTVNGVNDTLVVYEHWRNESAVWDIHMNQPYSKITRALMEKAVVGDMKQYMSFVTEIK